MSDHTWPVYFGICEAEQQRRILQSGYAATGREWGLWGGCSGGENGLSEQERDISRYKTTNIIVMVLSENVMHQNYLFSFVLLTISFYHGQHYSTTHRATAKSILNDTKAHCMYTHTSSLHHKYLFPAYTLHAHFSYIYIYINNLPYFCHITNGNGVVVN